MVVGVLTLPALPASAQSVALAPVFPESAYFDAGTGSWFVSNLGPVFSPDAKTPADGFVSKIDATTGLVTQRWVEGLSAPKGMRVHRGKLYVADIDTLVVIDIASAKVVRNVVLPGAAIINDVDVDKTGTAYVTDWTGNRIYRVDPRGRASVFVASPELEGPNGIIVDGSFLTIATWGPNITASAPWTTDEPGRIIRVDIKRRTITPLGSGERIAGLDGIERDGASYIVTDWSGGRVLRVALDGSYETLMELPPSAADIGFDRKTRTLGVPIILASSIVFETI